MKLSYKQRSDLYKDRMSDEEILAKLENITRPVIIDVISCKYKKLDRFRILYPNGAAFYRLNSFRLTYTLDYDCCFAQDAIENRIERYDMFKNYNKDDVDYSTEEHRTRLKKVILQMLKYDNGNSYCIIDIFET